MSDPRLISPMLDGFVLGGSMSCHSGVNCYPAMRSDSDERFIVKTISIPASQVQLDALLLTGAYPDAESAKGYFQELTKDVRNEVEILDKLSQKRGFVPYSKYQIAPLEKGVGYEIFLLSPYRKSLARQMRTAPLTQLEAVNMGIDLCAALSVCRDSGYLYVDLKPENIFLIGDREYQIGDLGFVDLASLKYASLPDRCRSIYIPAEISDAYATLNTTMDTYALGLILYQIYNNGQLPFDSEENRNAFLSQAGEVLPPPAYADYEMAEIIMKACSPNVEDRWESPNEMGHALIAYMQRNDVNDIPIIPPAPPVLDSVEPSSEEDPDSENVDFEDSEDAPDSESVPSPENSSESTQDDESEEASSESQTDEPSADWIDRMGAILSEDSPDTEPPSSENEPPLRELLEYDEQDAQDVDEDTLTGETADILNQAQELIEHEAPEPAVAPEPIDIPMPEPIVLEDEPQEDAGAEWEDDEDTEDAPDAEAPEDFIDSESDTEKPSQRSYKKLIRNTVAAVFLCALLYGGYFLISNFLLIPIDSFTIEGKDDVLTVSVETSRSESQILVVCTDNFGNVITEPLKDGKASFRALAPNSQYLVTLEALGYQKLVGDVGQRSYATPTRTQVISFTATTGADDGSAVINFAVEGPDSESWTLHYWTEDEAEKTVTFSGHTTTVSGLTLDKSYTFRLSAGKDVYLIGESQITFFSGEAVFAENISVYGSAEEGLNVTWKGPDGIDVEKWTVRCFNEQGYDQKQEVTDTAAVFADTSVSDAYTVEITAAGMSQSMISYITANPINITDLNASVSGAEIAVGWEYQGVEPASGWLVLYTVDGGEEQQVVRTATPSATIYPAVPGSHYDIIIQSADSTSVFGGSTSVDIPEITESFSGFRLTSDDISVDTFVAPDYDWGRHDLGDSTTVFAPGDKMALHYFTLSIYNLSDEDLVTLFVIRDADGKLAAASSNTRSWNDMWDSGHCLEEIYSLPAAAGDYTLEIYIDQMLLDELEFTIQ